jgi:predicted DNA-binding antitoxin AbrB/MazE fold protein
MNSLPTTIEAVFSGGVLRPLGDVNLQENQRVRLTVVPLSLPPQFAQWLRETAAFRQECYEKYGYFPDSAETVAADRRRDG